MGTNWCPGWESNPPRGLILRKLLILQNGKMEKNHKNAEVRYTAGTRNGVRHLWFLTAPLLSHSLSDDGRLRSGDRQGWPDRLSVSISPPFGSHGKRFVRSSAMQASAM